MERTKLLISLPRALNIRNFLLGDFITKIKPAFDEIHVLTDFSIQKEFKKTFGHLGIQFWPYPKLGSLICNWTRQKIWPNYYLGLRYLYMKQPFTSMFFKMNNGTWNWLKAGWVKRTYIRVFITIGRLRLFQGLKKTFLFWLFSPPEYMNLIREIKPSLIMTTYIPHTGEIEEESLLQVGKNLGIKTVSHISGIDNLTLKAPYGVLPDYMIVWNDMMKNHARIIYSDFPEENIFITPPPQFEDYGDFSKLLNRGEFLDAIGQNRSVADKKIITVISNGGVNYNSAQDELDIFKELYNKLKKTEFKDEVLFFIRRSATRNETPWENLINQTPGVISRPVTMAHSNRRGRDFKWEHEPNDFIFLQSLIRHSAIVISACSTISIDACLCNVPCICIAYDGNSKVNNIFQSMIRKPLEDHFYPLALMGAGKFAMNADELFDAVVDSLRNPNEGKAARAKASEFYFSGKIGQPHKDVAQILIDLAGKEIKKEQPVLSAV